jgi:hypothetical protein
MDVNGTNFNINDITVKRISSYLKQFGKVVIVHGDGMLFAGEKAFTGSDHHRKFNSGVELNTNSEAVSRAKFRAIYKEGDTLPTTVKDVIDEFFAENMRELKENTAIKPTKINRPSFIAVDDIEEEAPMVKKIKKTV